jgi:hypothetical protein
MAVRNAVRQELRAYLGNRELSCAPEGYDRYRRVLAICLDRRR